MSISSLSDSLSALQDIFGKADKNKSGGLSKSEFAAAAQMVGFDSASAGTTPDALFHKMDTSGDGELSSQELSSGVKLSQKVHDALLMAQELMSGSTLMNMLGGKSETDTIASQFTQGGGGIGDFTGTGETGSTDAYTSMLQGVIAKYKEAETEAAAAPLGSGTSVSA